MDWVEMAQTQTKRLEALADEAVRATTIRDMAVRRLIADGMSYAAIGQAIGLSKSRVAQIAQRHDLLDVGGDPEGQEPH